MIRTYLSGMINDHKTQEVWKIHSGNKVIDYKTQGEWKIQLSMKINFMSSKNSDEIRTMQTKCDDRYFVGRKMAAWETILLSETMESAKKESY